MDNYGINFAPTQQNSEQGPMRGRLDGIPAALKILALRMPRVVGARAPSPAGLLNARGAQGMDPMASAVLQTIMGLGGHGGGPGSFPGGTAGPNFPGLPGGGGFPGVPGAGSPPQGGGGSGKLPRVVYAPLPGGTAGPGPNPPSRPPFEPPLGGRGGIRGRIPF